MECVEMALIRKGFRSGLMGMGCGLKQAPLPVVLVEDSWAANAGESGGSGNGYGDDSFVDELLNLNNDNTEDGLACVEETDEKDDEKASAFPSPPLTTIEPKTENINNKDSLKDDDFGSVLIVPADEPDLDWLSQFVEDSFSEFSTPFPVNFPLKPGSGARTSAPTMATPGLMKSKRSKRARAGGRNWSFGSSPVLTDSTTTSSSSSTSSSPPSLSSTRITFIPNSPSQQADGAKKQRMRRATEETGGVSDAGGSQQAPRRCSHCGVQKTPQWRTGPNGAKTLCNACGVRYKSGRLLPEYRPACSPTFSSEMHSNNHRKVLEMRRKKQDLMLMMAVTGRSPPPGGPVPSFV